MCTKDVSALLTVPYRILARFVELKNWRPDCGYRVDESVTGCMKKNNKFSLANRTARSLLSWDLRILRRVSLKVDCLILYVIICTATQVVVQ